MKYPPNGEARANPWRHPPAGRHWLFLEIAVTRESPVAIKIDKGKVSSVSNGESDYQPLVRKRGDLLCDFRQIYGPIRASVFHSAFTDWVIGR